MNIQETAFAVFVGMCAYRAFVTIFEILGSVCAGIVMKAAEAEAAAIEKATREKP